MHTISTQVAGIASAVRGVGSSALALHLSRMAPTTLSQLDAVALLNRSDTKFLLTQPQLISILPALAPDYRVLEIEGRRLHHYRTLYFDTPDFDLYRHHHAGRAVRNKVRSRLYVDTGLSFFEIKSKQDEHRTVKQRLATPAFLTRLTLDTRAFVASYLSMDAQALQPTLRNDFLRVTLVGKCYTERLTLDLNVQFDCEGRAAILPGIVIAELKQGEPDQNSPFLYSMRQAHVDATSISKYCVGIGLLVDTVEHEAFDDKLNELERLMRTQTESRLVARGDDFTSQA